MNDNTLDIDTDNRQKLIGSMPKILRPQASNDNSSAVAVLKPKAIRNLSDALTKLEQQFNRMVAYTDNITTIKKAQYEAAKDNAREIALENTDSADLNLPDIPSVANDNDNDDIVEALTGLRENMSQYNESIVTKVLGVFTTIIGLGALTALFTSSKAQAEPIRPSQPETQVQLEAQEAVTAEAGRRGQVQEQPQQQYPAVSADIQTILDTIKERESYGGRYDIHDTVAGSSASGAYQFTDSTWQAKAREYGIDISSYPRAYMAPPEVQDEVARRYVEEILANTNGDVSMVPVVWLSGNYRGQIDEAGRAINPTMEAYRSSWMAAYNRRIGEAGTSNRSAAVLPPARYTSQAGTTGNSASWFRPATNWIGPRGQAGSIAEAQRSAGIRITSGFGTRASPGGIGSTDHKGYDIAAPRGTPIFSIARGVVSFAGVSGGYGNMVEVVHGTTGNGAVLSTRYAHMSSINVREGSRVEQFSQIGAVGSTGDSTGNHLHFEFRVNGRPSRLSSEAYVNALPAAVLGLPPGSNRGFRRTTTMDTVNQFFSNLLSANAPPVNSPSNVSSQNEFLSHFGGIPPA